MRVSVGNPISVLRYNTANPSLTDDGFKIMFSNTPVWLCTGLKGNRFKIPHSTYINRCQKVLVNVSFVRTAVYWVY